MDLGIKGKLALVTGSTQGIGYAVARMLAAEGVRVIVNGRRGDLLERALRQLGEVGEVHGIDADLSPADGARRVLAATHVVGRIDILINNVGFFEVRAFAAITDAEWTSMFELNVMSGVRLTRELMPGMLERDWGRIVFIASEQSAKPNPDMIHYAMSKAAQVVFLCSERAAAVNGAAQRVDGGIIRSLF